MKNNICPRCASEIGHNLLYKCVRCFTLYCKKCADASEGQLCPKCGLSQRMLISAEKLTALGTSAGHLL